MLLPQDSIWFTHVVGGLSRANFEGCDVWLFFTGHQAPDPEDHGRRPLYLRRHRDGSSGNHEHPGECVTCTKAGHVSKFFYLVAS